MKINSQELANNLDVSVSAVNFWKSGRQRPSFKNILKINDLYGMEAVKEIMKKFPPDHTRVKDWGGREYWVKD